MKFKVDWHESASNASMEERATVADLRVSIGGRNVCEYRPQPQAKVVEDHVTVSVYPLAEEIAFNWWSLFGARDSALRLVDGRSGYVIPDIRMQFDGVGFDAVCRPCSYDDTPAFFPLESAERLTREGAEKALGGFVSQVVGRLDDEGIGDCGLPLRWKRVRESREDAGETAFCEAAGALGIDPYDVSDSDADLIEQAGAFFTEEPLMEMLSGLHGPPSADRPLRHTLDWIREAEKRPRRHSRVPALGGLRTDLANVRRPRAGERPWATGYRCARAVRHALGACQAERFHTVKTLLDRLDARSFVRAGFVPGIRAVVQSREDSVHVHLRREKSRYGYASQLFALGRAIGDAVANPPAERSAVNDLHKASRQATGRAFAAEFLAPVDEVLSMREDNMDTGMIAGEFGVSEELIERQIENEARIAAACEA